MSENRFEVLKTRDDVLNRVCELLGVERETKSGYLTRDEAVLMLERVYALKDNAEDN